jgi:cysteine desulfurase
MFLQKWRSHQPIPQNVILLGTLNSDETTYDLSPKVIDRSYTITYPIADFNQLPKQVTNQVANQINSISSSKLRQVLHDGYEKNRDLIKNGKSREVIFTSGATESINLVLQGLLPKSPSSHKLKIAVLPIEHKAVLDTCDALTKKGIAEIIFLKVDRHGNLDIEHLETFCHQGIDLICVMAANNEIGTIYPVQEIGAIAQQYDIPFLCDATQAVGKIPINFRDWDITYLTLSGHKMYAPKGIGALVLRKGYQLEPLIYGGGQQKGIRAGTLNVAGIAGLGEACRLRQLEMSEDEKVIAAKRDLLQSLLLESIPDLAINGDLINRLAGNRVYRLNRADLALTYPEAFAEQRFQPKMCSC